MMKTTSIQEFLNQDEKKDLLRFLMAGSVDDGKSTLIGRLLFDSKKLYEDQLDALKRDSVKEGHAGGEIDYALLLDGLKAEREQGITIDVAYRYFSTNKRKFIIADTPGHEQYTRNMITGGSTANLAYSLERRLFDLGVIVVLIDGFTIRSGLSKELDFSPADRAEHLRRVAHICRILNDQGVITICSFISPNEDIRQQCKYRVNVFCHPNCGFIAYADRTLLNRIFFQAFQKYLHCVRNGCFS